MSPSLTFNGGIVTFPKRSILGILVTPTTYMEATEFVIRSAEERHFAAISALAVHGIMTGVLDPEQKFRLNTFDLIVPDGQPVRWALNLLHHAGLSDRVAGPTLTLALFEAAAAKGLSIYLYGSTTETLARVRSSVAHRFPALRIAGLEPSKFRRLTPLEKDELAARIRSSGASILFVGLGCPRQEIFTYEFRGVLDLPVLAVGAAFPFIAGLLPRAPNWIQTAGMEWFVRLLSEPRRLWKRYLYLNPIYIVLILLQMAKLSNFATEGKSPASELLFG